jgi:hypothetical protein
MIAEPQTLPDAIVYFDDPSNCRDYLVQRRWPDGVTCPNCGGKDVQPMEGFGRWRCRSRHDDPEFTLRTGTVMEDSSLSLDRWLIAMWTITNCTASTMQFEQCSKFSRQLCDMLGTHADAACHTGLVALS